MIRFVRLMLAVVALVVVGMPNAIADSIRVGGTGSVSAIMQILIDAYRLVDPSTRIDLVTPPLGSTAGIRAVASGSIDLAVSGRSLKPDEAQGLAATEIARTPLVFASNRMAAKLGLTRSEIADMFSGRQTRWEDDTPIRLVTRPLREADSLAVQNLSPELASALKVASERPGMVSANNDGENSEILLKAPGSLGIITLGQIKAARLALRPFALDGVTPSMQAMAVGKYPLYKPVVLVVRANPGPALRRWMDFLKSARAAAILRSNDFMPSIQ